MEKTVRAAYERFPLARFPSLTLPVQNDVTKYYPPWYLPALVDGFPDKLLFSSSHTDEAKKGKTDHTKRGLSASSREMMISAWDATLHIFIRAIVVPLYRETR